MLDMMSLTKEQSALISNLQKTISSLQNTIDGLNARIESTENVSRGIDKDISKDVSKNVDKDINNVIFQNKPPTITVNMCTFNI